MNKMLKLTMTVALLVMFGMRGYSQQPIKASGGEPVFHNTGNPAVDAANYEAAKQAWVNANPAEYRQALSAAKLQVSANQSTGRVADHAAERLAHSSNPWGSNDNKAAWVAAHSNEYKTMTQTAGAKVSTQGTPWGSGDKQAWINAHKDEYRTMLMSDPSFGKTTMTQAEFNAFPPAKQAAIKNDSRFVIVEPTKQ